MHSARVYARSCALAWSAAPRLVCLLMLAHLGQAVVPAAQAWIYKWLVDGVARGGVSVASDVWSAGTLFLVTLFFSQASASLIGTLGDAVSERLQGEMGDRVLTIAERQRGLGFYEDETVQNDLGSVRRGIDYSMLEAVSLVPLAAQKLIMAVTLSLVLARLHPLLPALLVCIALPRFRYEARLRGYIWTGITGQSPHFRWMTYFTSVLLRAESAKEVRLFGLGEFFRDRYRGRFERAHEELVRIRRQELRGTTLYSLLDAAVTGSAYAAIVLAASRGGVTAGDVALYTAATFQLSGALLLLTQFWGGLVNHRLRLQMFFELLDRPAVLAEGPVQPLPPPPSLGREGECGPGSPYSPSLPRGGGGGRGSPVPLIELCDVWFSYPGSAAPALRGLSLRIEPGQKIAIAGENGAGKTTLVSLLARLYDPDQGEVRIDGRSLRALDLRAWREQIAGVSQEFLRLEAPLRLNLALAALHRSADDAALRVVCEQVGLADLLEKLPGGLDQMLGRPFEGGVELSGGEWQKVALARALLREEARLVLLDEPTSALDAPTEYALFQQFMRLAAHRTALLISHRFSTVAMADRIVLLEAGAIREEGSHAELMARGGKYAELFELQASRYR